MSELVTTEPNRTSILEMQPSDLVEYGARVANTLSDLIRQQGLYSTISGRDYVRVEGWLTLGSMLGIYSRERNVTELEDGSFLAEVELVSVKTNSVVGLGSALCGMDEKRWRTADRYARRSMAITRATGKAYRMAFSWIMCLAGYEGTPEEEMPGDMRARGSNPPLPPTKVAYDNDDNDHKRQLVYFARELGINDKAHWAAIGSRIAAADFPVPLVDLEAAVKEVWKEIQLQ